MNDCCICQVIKKQSTLYIVRLCLLGEVPSTVSQRMDGKTVYVNKPTRTENSAMDHATKQRLRVIAYLYLYVDITLLLCDNNNLLYS